MPEMRKQKKAGRKGVLSEQEKAQAQYWLERIREVSEELREEVNLMEVCGTHTVAIAQHGLRELLPPGVRLISGPGCPVCVTASEDIDLLLGLAEQPGVLLATFGDLMRVPGSGGSLQEKKAQGARVQVVYSTLDALKLAEENPGLEVVFAGIGFETTAPTVAVSIEEARRRGIKNYSVWSLHKLVPPALRVLLEDPAVNIDGFINPGHVCTILGTAPFEFVARDYRRPCVVAGFEAVDVLETVFMILDQLRQGEARVDIQYRRAVRPEGNPAALRYMEQFFEPATSRWRGIGAIPGSGLKLRPAWAEWDAEKKFSFLAEKLAEDLEKGRPVRERAVCLCGAILKGQKHPFDCPSFGEKCTPWHPVGPCMVSQEGACAAYYRYYGAARAR